MSDKRSDNKPKPHQAFDAYLLDADQLDSYGTQSSKRRGGDRESHHAGAQPRPATRP